MKYDQFFISYKSKFVSFTDEIPKQDLPIEYILPFYCYHCERRFKSKPILKDHEEIHRDEKLIKIMKHPFVMKPSQFKKNEWIEMDKIVPSMYLPFMPRNLPKSLKDKLDRPKGKLIKI